MNKEQLARWIVILLVLAAVGVPLGGRWLSKDQAATLELHARMPENGGWSVDTIQAEVGQPIHLRLTSDDVVHGFAVGRSDQPALDIFPGEFTETTLTLDRPGKYIFYCSRWCGANHWRMRGTIEVSGEGDPIPPDPQPLFLKLGIDIDAPQAAEVTPGKVASAGRGALFASQLPPYALEKDTYLANSPAQVWVRLRAETTLSTLSDDDLWDAVAWIWQQQTTPEALKSGQELYATNCAACHGENGKGDGVMVRGLPVWDPSIRTSDESTHQPTGEGLFSPPDFTDPKVLLGASPALLEGKIIRGGMGTGMPYWGPIFTSEQLEALTSFLYTFSFQSREQLEAPSN
jgi:mono/diheme cytochrome c family protein